jgi:hypothetical protein
LSRSASECRLRFRGLLVMELPSGSGDPAHPGVQVIRSLDVTGKGRQRWRNRWKPALNAVAITFGGRIFVTA